MKVRALYSCDNNKYTENKEYVVIERTNDLIKIINNEEEVAIGQMEYFIEVLDSEVYDKLYEKKDLVGANIKDMMRDKGYTINSLSLYSNIDKLIIVYMLSDNYINKNNYIINIDKIMKVLKTDAEYLLNTVPRYEYSYKLNIEESILVKKALNAHINQCNNFYKVSNKYEDKIDMDKLLNKIEAMQLLLERLEQK